jgi:endoglucanase
MAQNLVNAGIDMAHGLALNVSNFFTTESNITYGMQISNLAGGKHFIIDTSRNGLGPTTDHQWCTPLGRALGAPPQTFSSGLVDAYLWIKRPGESDGTCNGGPSAGLFWPQYAYDLAVRAK